MQQDAYSHPDETRALQMALSLAWPRRHAATRPENTAVVRSTSLGDFANFLPFLAHLVSASSVRRVTVLELSRWGQIAGRFLPPGTPAVQAVDLRTTTAAARDCVRTLRYFRREGPHEVILTPHPIERPLAFWKRALFARALTGPGSVLVGLSDLSAIRVARAARDVEDCEVVHVARLPFETNQRAYDVSREHVFRLLALSDEEVTRASDLARWESHSGPTVALSVSSRMERKSWPLAAYEALARHLIESHGARIVLTGGAEDVASAEALRLHLPQDRVRVAAGKLSPRESIALGRFLSCAVGNDGAPLHFAALGGAPAVGLYCNWQPAGLWEPILAPRSVAIRPARVLDEERRQEFGIRRISLATVRRTVDAMLATEDSAANDQHRILLDGPDGPSIFRRGGGFPFTRPEPSSGQGRSIPR